MNPNHEIYKMMKVSNQVRKDHQVWTQPAIERYIDDNFYAFSRGDVLVALTNFGGSVSRTVTYLPFKEGETVCNIFNRSDCQTVSQGKLNVNLDNYQVKVYVKASSLDKEQSE